MGAYHYSSDILPLLLSAVMPLALAVYAWRQRAVPGATPFAITQLLLAAANLANIFEISANDLPLMLVWRQAWYLYLVLVPLAWLAFAIEYAGWSKRLTRRVWALLAAPSAISAVLMLTNDWHRLIWERVWFDGILLVERGIAGRPLRDHRSRRLLSRPSASVVRRPRATGAHGADRARRAARSSAGRAACWRIWRALPDI